MDTTFKKARIGIFGGTFDPVHLGHLVMAQNAVDVFELGQVLFVPCASPPHKDSSRLLSPEHRLAMLSLAVEGDLRFEVSAIEIRRGGRSYTIDTICGLRESYPQAELYFLIGSDSLPELRLWRNINELLALCTFVTFRRPGMGLDRLRADEIGLEPPWPERLLANFVAGPDIGISSSDIRHRVAEGMSIRYLVPQAVEIYITEHGLYRGRDICRP